MEDKILVENIKRIKELQKENEELKKQNDDLKSGIEWYKMWHKHFQKDIKKLQDELETYRPTKLTGNGACSCFGCEQKNGFNSHWTDWCYRYKGHIYCYKCLQEILKK